MRKLKYLLILSLIAVLAVGVFVGCQELVGVDEERTPCKVTYCANGGNLDGKTERYLYLERNGSEKGKEVHVPEPASTNRLIKQPTREGYEFVGWVRGELDEATRAPKLYDTPVHYTDGGVYMNADGAITAETAATDDTAVRSYYKYERESDVATHVDKYELFDFAHETVEGDIVLVAIWKSYKKFVLADRTRSTANNGFEDLSYVYEDNFYYGSEFYSALEEENRLWNIETEDGTILRDSILDNAYNHLRGKDYTYIENDDGTVDEVEGDIQYTRIKYYLDPECTEELKTPYTVPGEYAVFYYTEVRGDYDIVYNAAEFSSGINSNRNMYIYNDITLGTKDSPFTPSTFVTYGKTIEGNNNTINAHIRISQTKASKAENNIYGALFGDMRNATIKNLTLNADVEFRIEVDPEGVGNPYEPENTAIKGTEADKDCYYSVFARSMTNCVLQNVTVDAYYEVTRSEFSQGEERDENGELVDIVVKNTFKVEAHLSSTRWLPKESQGTNNTFTDCAMTVRPISEKPEEPEEEPQEPSEQSPEQDTEPSEQSPEQGTDPSEQSPEQGTDPSEQSPEE